MDIIVRNMRMMMVDDVHQMIRYLVKENLGLPQDVLQLGQLQEVLLQRLCVLVDLAQLVLQFLKRCLKGIEFS